jgi:hypothetical protein
MICMCMLVMSANAQLRFAIGGGLLYGSGKLPQGAEEGSEKPTILGYGIFVHPRFNVTETESGAVSIGIPATLGFSGTVNSREGGSMSITADLPVTADYNFGAGSTEDNESGFGGFIGAGFGYTYTNQTYDYSIPGATVGYEQLKGSTYGPLVNAGIRASITDKTYFLRVFYKIGLEKEKFKTFGASVGVSF